MEWKTDLPNKDGFYWIRAGENNEPSIVNFQDGMVYSFSNSNPNRIEEYNKYNDPKWKKKNKIEYNIEWKGPILCE